MKLYSSSDVVATPIVLNEIKRIGVLITPEIERNACGAAGDKTTPRFL